MTRIFNRYGVLLGLTLCFIAPKCPADQETGWPQWRGPGQDGVASSGDVPLRWEADSPDQGDGIRWRIEIPGRGGSTPVIAGDHAFLTSGFEGKNHLLAVELSSGKIAWMTPLGEDTGNQHKKGSGSNPSAVTDGQHVWAYFRSGDVGCVDVGGSVIWQKNIQEMYGDDTLWWDLGTSPVITDDAVIITVMHSTPTGEGADRKNSDSNGFLVGFDKLSGNVLWKEDRNTDAKAEAAQSYSTPVLVEVDGMPMLAVMGADHATLHNAKTGETIADVGGFNPTEHMYNRSIASPVTTAGILLCPYNRGSTVTAIDLKKMAAGQKRDAIAWHRDDLGSDVPTPAATDGVAYFVNDKDARGTVTAVDAKTGETLWQASAPKSRVNFSSSPLIANNHLYVVDEAGTTFVFGPLDADQPKLLATNPVVKERGITVASPVPVDGGLLIRTRDALYRIGR